MSRKPSLWSKIFGGNFPPRRGHGDGHESRGYGHDAEPERRDRYRETDRQSSHNRPRRH